MKKISSTETTVFVYNAGGRLVAEYSTVLAETQQVSYLTTDHLGSPRVVTNGSGAVVSRKDFAAFGDEVATPQRTQGLGYQPTGLRQDYTGYEKDDESGLEFAQARYYNPTHGRFTSVDPLTASATIRNPQTFNRYAYALNSPYKFTDPLGLIPSTTGACGQWCQNYASDQWGGSTEFDSLAGAPPIWPFIYEVTRQTTITYRGENGQLYRMQLTDVWYENSYGAYLGRRQSRERGDPQSNIVGAANLAQIFPDAICNPDPEFDGLWSFSQASTSAGGLINDERVVAAMKSAWIRSGIGTRNTEAGFLVFQAGNEVLTVDLPNTNQYDSISFNVSQLREKALVPETAKLLAVFHTHPTNRSDQPSIGKTRGDNVVARLLNVPVFVMHLNGLSSISPTGERARYLRRGLKWLQQ